MADDILRLRAIINTEEGLANIRKMATEIGLMQTRAGRGAKEATTYWAQLGVSIKQAGREVSGFSTALGGIGLGAAGVGFAVGALARQMNELSKRMVAVQHLSKEVGLSERDIRAWGNAAERAGISAQSMQQNLRNFNNIAQGLRYNVGGVRDELIRMGAGSVVRALQSARDPAERLRIAFQFKDTLMRIDPTGFKARTWFEMLGLGAESARLTLEEFNKEQAKLKPLTPEQQAEIRKFREGMQQLGHAWDQLLLKAGIRIFPDATAQIESLTKLIEKLDWLDDFVRRNREGPGGTWFGNLLQGWFGTPTGPMRPSLAPTPPPAGWPTEEEMEAAREKLRQQMRGGGQQGNLNPFGGQIMPASFGSVNTGGFTSSHGFTVMRPGTGTASAEDQNAIRIVRTGVYEALIEFQSYIEASTGGVRNASLGGRGGVGMGGGAGGGPGGGPGGGGPGAGSGSGPGTRSNTSTNDTTPATGPLHGGPVSGVTQVGRDAQGNLVAPPLSIQGIQDALAGKAPVGVTQVPPSGLPGMSLEGIGAAVRGEAQPGGMPAVPAGAQVGGGRGGPAGAGLRGDAAANAQRMYDTLRGLGHSHQQASAALAHARAESSFNPRTVGDRGTAFGFFQMRGVRWANAQRKAREWGLDPYSPEAAARFLDWELRNDPANAGRGVGQRYFGAQTTDEAVTALNGYERFAGWQRGQPRRSQYGRQFEGTMSPSGAPSGAAVPPGAVAPTGPVPGQGSTSQPHRIQGKVQVGGQWFDWASGGNRRGSLPWGTHNINIGRGDIGPIGQQLGSIATLGGLGGVMADPRYRNARAGIQIHAGDGATLDKLYTAGCFAVPRAQWPAFKAALLEQARLNPGGLQLRVGSDGMAYVEPRGTGQPRNATIPTAGARPPVAPAVPAPELTPPPATPRIDAAVGAGNVSGRVAVTVNSNGTKADAGVTTEGNLFQDTTVKQHRQMVPTEVGASAGATI